MQGYRLPEEWRASRGLSAYLKSLGGTNIQVVARAAAQLRLLAVSQAARPRARVRILVVRVVQQYRLIVLQK
jgi:hypothetical protein